MFAPMLLRLGLSKLHEPNLPIVWKITGSDQKQLRTECVQRNLRLETSPKLIDRPLKHGGKDCKSKSVLNRGAGTSGSKDFVLVKFFSLVVS